MPLPSHYKLGQRAYKMFLISFAFGCMLLPVIILILASLLLPVKGFLCVVVFEVVVAVIPLRDPPIFLQKYRDDAVKAAREWAQIRVIYEQEKFSHAGPYVIGLEPHSVLPVAVPAMMHPYSGLLPKNCSECFSLATSAAFLVPFGRQVWWWLNIRPATRKTFDALLAEGKSVCVVPGGVQECLHMEPGREVAYLTKRLGFIRCAMKKGAPLVPAFAFGQSEMYQYIRPGPPLFPASAVSWLSKRIGFCPLVFWGWCFTPAPYDAKMTVVFGNPISVPQVDAPTEDDCRHYNSLFVTEMERIFSKYKDEAGYSNLELEIM